MANWRDYIPSQILKRGEEYYSDCCVEDLERNGSSYTATVEGTEDYYVVLKIENGKVKAPTCTCPYAEEHRYCKHIAAVLFEIEDEYGKGVFSETVTENKAPQKKEYVTLTFEDDGGYHYLNFGRSLKEYCPTKKTYEEAIQMVKTGAVTNRSTHIANPESDTDKALIYEVRVNDSAKNDTALVTINLGRKGILNITCVKVNSWYYYGSYVRNECSIYRADRTGVYELCVHKTAALLSLFDFLRENRDIIDHSDQAALEIINSFSGRRKKTGEKSSEEYTVDIEPTVTRDLQCMTMKVMGANGRYYKVRDAEKFINTVTMKGVHSLTKDSEIDFGKVTLSDRAEKVMKVAQSAVMQNLTHRTSYFYHEKDELDIRSVLDDFYSTLSSSEVLTITGARLAFEETEPSFFMEIDEVKSSGKRIGIRVKGEITAGRETSRYIYWDEDNTLYRADKRNLGAAAQFLKNADSEGKFAFTVGMGNIDRFYQRVLPELRKSGKITDNAEAGLEGVLKEAPTAIFEVDCINDVIFCSAHFRYDNNKLQLFPYYNFSAPSRSTLCPEFQRDTSDSLDEIFTGPYSKEGFWTLKTDDDSVYNFYREGLNELSKLGELYVTDAVHATVKKMPQVSSFLDINEDDSILNFNLELGDLTIEELVEILKSYRNKRKFHRLRNGDFVSLEDVSLDALADIFLSSGLSIKDFTEGKMHLPLYRALYLDQILMEQNGVTYEAGQKFRQLIKDFRTINESDYAVPASLENVMRSYQKDGYRWMRILFEHGFGGILADDMGLGKTVQALSLLKGFKDEGKNMHTLIISPTSLIYNWKAEARKFTPELNAVTISGAAQERAEIIKENENYDILITSYDLLKRDIALYEGIQFDIEIIDEAQFIKNHNTAQAKAVRAVSSKHRLALTGTPIENRLSELWSIFEYLMPGFLFSEMKFKELLSNPIEKDGDKEAYDRLRKLTGPFILRRLKTDVLKDLPEKIEETRVASLEGEQLRLYTAEVAKAQGMLKKGDEYSEKKIEILAELTRIREICCDPSLVFKDYKGESAKRTALMDLIESAIDGGHRILLFSQFTSMLELLESDLKEKEIEYYKITGDTPKAKRLELVDAFNSGATPLFLISLKAGGTGLNLTGADIVIHYDPWWNTAAQDQATDRAHRIGQTKRVTVYRMIAQDTIEEKIVKLQETKKNLADGIVSGDNVSLSSLSKEDLLELLSISDIDK